jgi:hypothetical protein
MNGQDRTEQHEEQQAPVIVKKRRGRPRGSKNRLFAGMQREEGWGPTPKLGRPKSLAAHRKWQRDFVLPQFVLTRKQATDLLVKYLRSKPGKPALSSLLLDGFVGTSKMPDNKLGEFLMTTNLLSRYPHEVVIRGA